MRKLKTGIVFDLSPSDGGAYEQALATAKHLLSLASDTYNFHLIYFKATPFREKILKDSPSSILSLSSLKLFLLRLRVFVSSNFRSLLLRSLLPPNFIENHLAGHGIDLLYFLSPSPLANLLESTNYVFTIWDLCHVENSEFPEIRSNWQFDYREKNLSRALRRAHKVSVESEYTKSSVCKFYGIPESKCFIVPLNPGRSLLQDLPTVSSNSDLLLDFEFVIYPAQLWPHKNHVQLLHALSYLEKDYSIRIGAIFPGSEKGGHRSYLDMTAEALGIAPRILFPGYVEPSSLRDMYLKSIALVMPTYFGPTNIPPIEAFSLGVPVIYPLRADHYAFLGDAAEYFRYGDVASLGSAILHTRDDDRRRELTESGHRWLIDRSSFAPGLALIDVLANFRSMRACWI